MRNRRNTAIGSMGCAWGIGRVDQYGNTNGLGHQVAQQPQPLSRDLSDEEF
jgi:hypothetical protein